MARKTDVVKLPKLNKPCVIRRLEWTNTIASREIIKGKFIEDNGSHLLFKSNRGWKESFMKNSIGIDWAIER